MLIKEIVINAATGEKTERWVDMPGVITEEEAIELERLAALEEQKRAIKAEMDEADIAIIRALVENDQTRIQQHRLEQQARRKQLSELK